MNKEQEAEVLEFMKELKEREEEQANCEKWAAENRSERKTIVMLAKMAANHDRNYYNARSMLSHAEKLIVALGVDGCLAMEVRE